MNTSPIDVTTLSALFATIEGRVITPADADYDKVRRVASGLYDCRPAAIIQVAGAHDVARVVNFARETGVEMAVRSGGHSAAGHSTTDGGIVIDLSGMKRLEVDPHARTAWAETGLTAGEITVALAEHGLAVGFGDTGSVGIGGITLGGGMGYLSRKYGLTIDSLLAADVVTADGRLLRADADTHPDLFWAIRGGGGNFGVVTRFLYRLYPVATVVGGVLILPATPDTVARFVAASEVAPEELTTIANVMPAPPMPFVPQEHHGKLVILALMCFAGDPHAAEHALEPFRSIAEPLVDMIRPMPYPQMYMPEDPDERPSAVVRALFLDYIDRKMAKMIVEGLQAPGAMRIAQIRVLGGAVARVPNEATAYAHRQSPILVEMVALFEDPAQAETHTRWVAELAAALGQGDGGTYVNFLMDEGEARVRAAYPTPAWERLAEVKRRYDPANLFCRNQNVPPAAGPASA